MDNDIDQISDIQPQENDNNLHVELFVDDSKGGDEEDSDEK